MIKILTVHSVSDFQLVLVFSNGEEGVFEGAAYLANRQGKLLEPLADCAYFRSCFVDAGALCWPNGLELSGERMLALSTRTVAA